MIAVLVTLGKLQVAVQEKPVTATMAGVGVGLLLGLLIASGRNNSRN